MLTRIEPEQATLGMYVQAFEGGWLWHPFWKAKFVISTREELMRIRDGGTAIIIDTAKGVGLALQDVDPINGSVSSAKANLILPPPSRSLPPPRMLRPSRRVVAPAAFGKADKASAEALAQRSTRVVKTLFDECRVGRSISTPQILKVVSDIANTLEQNSAALISVTRLKAKDDYTYTHLIAVCALMINLAREAGVEPQAVRDIGVGGLLHDIGKVQIDQTVLQKNGPLTDDERAHVARHPELGHAMLAQDDGVPPVALDICLHHHERLDGSGYPFGISGEAITPAARMAAICDVYDAMTSDRPYQRGRSPIAAITEMAMMEGQFDQNLLFRFMRSLGVFPPGKLVRLRSNRLAIVLPPVGRDCLPVVRAFYATVGSHFIDYDDAVLSERLCDDQAMHAEDPADWFSGDWTQMVPRITAGIPLQT